MRDALEFKYSPEAESFHTAVCAAFQTYIRIYSAFPKIVRVSHDEAGYHFPLFEIVLDATLPHGTFWMGR
jgi:hypothetical protein